MFGKKRCGYSGRLAHSAAENIGAAALCPGKVLAAAGLAAAVISGGLYVGWRLRRTRLNRSMDPYHYGRKPERNDSDYAMGI
jgi:hypothetical protein